MPRLAIRALVVAASCALALGIGMQWAEAQTSSDWCISICSGQCIGHDGCDFAVPVGCNCQYFCNDGHDGEQICVL